MSLVAKADLTTGCDACSSFVLRSEDTTFVVTAPSALRAAESELPLRCPIPGYDGDAAFDFVRVHGLAVRTIGALPWPPTPALRNAASKVLFGQMDSHSLRYRCVPCSAGFRVADAAAAYRISVANGGQGVLPPARIVDDTSGEEQTVSEIKAYGEGDVVIRFVSGNFGGPFLANYEAVEDAEAPEPLGVRRVDHIGASATDERKAIAYLANATGVPSGLVLQKQLVSPEYTAACAVVVCTHVRGRRADVCFLSGECPRAGMHRGVTFHTGDIGTSASGLTFEVVSNNEGTILFNITEPTQGTAVKSPMQRFLDHHRGSGVQHIALEARDIFAAVRRMRAKRGAGLGFMPRPSAEYYRCALQ